MAVQMANLKPHLTSALVLVARHGGKIVAGSFFSAASVFVYLAIASPMQSGITRTLFSLSLIACFLSGAWTAILQDLRNSDEIVTRSVAFATGVLVLMLLALIL